MSLKVNEIWYYIFLIVIMMPKPMMANEPEDFQYRFSITDSTLSFYGSFKTSRSPECLLEIFFNYNHIKALAPDDMEVQLVDQGSDWNLISYNLHKFIIFENISGWRRKLDRENKKLDFTLVSSVNNQAAMPEMITSSGSYHVKEQGGDIIVEYYQHCQLTKTIITDLFLKMLKNEAIHFIEKLSEYTNTNCSDIPVIDK